eukprot:TRINITY_DN3330_c0_g1_i11.p1 TRINITY_DN3330_c0_g1~~TRINITY_DN3330_c0_g1_i11.p1  ORF type:complete len:627 (-),score=65.47 TRINITY_DN3330_c0_g1_i11:2488-4368(-)
MKLLFNSGVLGNISVSDISNCFGCHFGKQHAFPYNKSTSFTTAPFALVHSDVWGPASQPTKGGSIYYVLFIDDFTRYTWLYLMKTRSELYTIYTAFSTMVATQFDTKIKIFRSDSGGEYMSHKFRSYLTSQGTLAQLSCPATPQQNGVAERKHRHILETARSLIHSSHVPLQFWGEAVLTATYLINRTPSTVLSGISSYEKLFSFQPDLSHLKVFGCTCFVLLSDNERTKLGPKSTVCVFLGYGIEQKGYRCYDPKMNKLRVSRNVTFLEQIPFYTLPIAPSSPEQPLIYPLDPFPDLFPSDSSSPPTLQVYHRRPKSTPATSDSEALPPPSDHGPIPSAPDVQDLPQSRRYPLRTRLPPSRFGFVCTDHFFPSYKSFLAAIHSLAEPRSYKEAILHPHWKSAIAEELAALQHTQTWDLVPLPSGKRAIGCKWIFKIKTKSDGTVDRYKARLVAKGYTQEYGVDYEETFAPVAKMTTVRIFISVAAVRHWPLYQLDVKNAFLNGFLQEELYMHPPPGVTRPPHYVCRLNRALYGLKQAPRAWFERFSTSIISIGFSQSAHDSALFTRFSPSGCVFLLLYVDDMIITGSDTTGILSLKSFLHRQFEMKDLGHLRYFLGIEVAYSPNG